MKKAAVILKGVSVLSILFLLVIYTGCSTKNGNDTKSVSIGSKHFTEQEILAEIMAILIEENSDIKVVRRFNLGGTMVCFSALKTGELDLYAEYTGTGLVNILKMKAVNDPDKVYRTVKDIFAEKYDLTWLKPFGFNNTYTLTMRKADAEASGIRKISDLIPYKDKLLPGFDAEFMQRPDGYPGLRKHYGFEFGKKPRQMDPGLMYKALKEKGVDIIDGFSTDGRIPAYNFVTLQDDKNFFPPYYATPLVRNETLSRYPEIREILNRLSGRIGTEEIRKLNYMVDKEEKRPSAVAKEFLKSKGLI
ncbi:MAG: glycine betaine ABC transporter substrate-binding protein [Nitrospirota bacterium]|nr:glycine betaine ABC transporter substrate-binding protein [Nitrospirota bacterium]